MLRDFFANPNNFLTQNIKPEPFPNLRKSLNFYTIKFININLKSTHDYIINSILARSSSQATLDSLDMTRFSEDGGGGVDERVAVLEFELRKARDNINSLRANLTVVTGS